MVKRVAKTCNLFCNIATKRVELKQCWAFYQSPSNLSCNKSGCCRQLKVVAESREQFYFLQQNLYMLRVLRIQAKANLFCRKWRHCRVWRDSCVFLSNEKSVFTQLAATSICLNLGDKKCNISFQHVLQQCCKTSCRFLLPVLQQIQYKNWQSYRYR